jgi:hypothetical protein
MFGNSSGTTYDTVLAQLVTQVTAFIDKEVGVRATAGDVSYDTITNEIVNADGTTVIKPKLQPIRTLTKIERKDQNGNWIEYTDETVGAIDFSDLKIYTKYIVAEQGYRNLRLSYTVGYKSTEVPADLEMAVTMIIAGIFNQRNMVGFSSQSVLGMSVSMSNGDYLYVKKVLTKYKPVNVL